MKQEGYARPPYLLERIRKHKYLYEWKPLSNYQKYPKHVEIDFCDTIIFLVIIQYIYIHYE